MIATVQHDDAMLRFVSSNDAARLTELGTSCPDHFLRTKIKPLFLDFDPHRESFAQLCAKTDAALAQYVSDYAAYYQSCRHADSPAMRAPEPTVILIPGIGMIAWGSSKSESRTTAEFYRCACERSRMPLSPLSHFSRHLRTSALVVPGVRPMNVNGKLLPTLLCCGGK